jgi:Holliday junction resolvasome RuvABC endonuclease subunit
VGSINRHVTGKGKAEKAAVISAVTALGYQPAYDNEADAIALLLYATAGAKGAACAGHPELQQSGCRGSP